ncbi:hypothetical protein [Pleionea litopenaei]|uniref:Uncharacterized protein n=1 Tax=Pleionea litopenaei TaxID=3070815 RepID=A0AA51RWQ5_9GAMM|nr:hypothetical protein [Pleionea sp. HL-JVS1]WMS89181.1 hypothetical protein Q9312_09795 [Pleionea sp. HL-JVS1]
MLKIGQRLTMANRRSRCQLTPPIESSNGKGSSVEYRIKQLGNLVGITLLLFTLLAVAYRLIIVIIGKPPVWLNNWVASGLLELWWVLVLLCLTSLSFFFAALMCIFWQQRQLKNGVKLTIVSFFSLGIFFLAQWLF